MSERPVSTTASSRLSFIALILALAGAGGMLYFYFGLFIPRIQRANVAKHLVGYSFGNDFFTVWKASQVWRQEGCYLYSPEMTREIQLGLYGRLLDERRATDPKDLRVFGYPAFTEILFWPAGLISFETIRWAIAFLWFFLTLASLLLWIRALKWQLEWPWILVAALLLFCSYPLLEGLYSGQIGLLVGFLLAASIFALQKNKLLVSGVFLALTTIKPHVSLLIIFYLALWSLHDWDKRRRFLIGLFATEACLVAGALIVWPHWIQSWVHVALQYRAYTPPPLVNRILETVLGSSAAKPLSSLLILAMLAASAALAWKHRAASPQSVEFWLTLTLMLAVTTVALLPGHAVYDQGILVPGICLLAMLHRRLAHNWVPKALFAMAVGILVWPWFASWLLILLHPMLTEQRFYSNAVFGLPLRLTPGFPFLILGLLGLAYRVNASNPDGALSLPR
jgi:hypothetical protein